MLLKKDSVHDTMNYFITSSFRDWLEQVNLIHTPLKQHTSRFMHVRRNLDKFSILYEFSNILYRISVLLPSLTK
jgi:hypothetical protein